jgi:N-acylneuraminate cytidylyltransferase
MNQSLAVFLPVRKGSERVKNKNTRPFSGYSSGLLGIKLQTLIKVLEIDKIILSTNDPEAINIGKLFLDKTDKLIIIERPDSLSLSSTSLIELVKYVPTVIEHTHILWTHVTSPFLHQDDYSNAIQKYFKAIKMGYDSLMSVVRFNNFLWDPEKNDIINRINSEKWPRTQDLKELFEIDSGIFIASREVYLKYQDRIGSRPYLYENNKIKSFDIDWEEDFKLAEIIFKNFIKATF